LRNSFMAFKMNFLRFWEISLDFSEILWDFTRLFCLFKTHR
jgi:hypothetical protein